MPMFWVSQDADLTSDTLAEMYWLVNGVRWGGWLSLGVGVVGSGLVITGVILQNLHCFGLWRTSPFIVLFICLQTSMFVQTVLVHVLLTSWYITMNKNRFSNCYRMSLCLIVYYLFYIVNTMLGFHPSIFCLYLFTV